MNGISSDVYMKAGQGNPHHDPLTGQFTSGGTNPVAERYEQSNKQEASEFRKEKKEWQQPHVPTHQQESLILPEKEARERGESVSDNLDVKSDADMMRASQETGGSRVFNFSTGEGGELDKNVKLVTNTNAQGQFEKGTLRVDIYNPETQRKTTYTRAMSELPALVKQLHSKSYSATTQHRRNTRYNMKSGGNPNHDELGRFASGSSSNNSSHDKTIKSVIESSGLSQSDFVIEDGTRESSKNAVAEYKPDEDKITIYKGALDNVSESDLSGIIAHEIGHRDTQETIKDYFKQRNDPSLDQSTFKALSGLVSNCMDEDNCHFTPYVSLMKKQFDNVGSAVNRFYLISEGSAEAARMKFEGKEYPEAWEKLNSAIASLRQSNTQKTMKADDKKFITVNGKVIPISPSQGNQQNQQGQQNKQSQSAAPPLKPNSQEEQKQWSRVHGFGSSVILRSVVNHLENSNEQRQLEFAPHPMLGTTDDSKYKSITISSNTNAEGGIQKGVMRVITIDKAGNKETKTFSMDRFREAINRLSQKQYQFQRHTQNLTKAEENKFITVNGRAIPLSESQGQAQDKQQAQPEQAQSESSTHPASTSNERYAVTLAKDMGLNPDKIQFADEDIVAEDGSKVGAEHDPDTGTITLYPVTFNRGPMELVGTLAHEGMHEKFSQVAKEYNKQKEEWSNGAGVNNTPVYAGLRDVFQNRATYELAGGVSDYSNTFWEKYKQNKTTQNYTVAINETLAETERLLQSGQDKQVGQQWKSLHAKVTKFYQELS